MMPDTWLPTCTVVTAESVPVAVTVATTSPLSSFAFRNFGSADPRRVRQQDRRERGEGDGDSDDQDPFLHELLENA